MRYKKVEIGDSLVTPRRLQGSKAPQAPTALEPFFVTDGVRISVIKTHAQFGRRNREMNGVYQGTVKWFSVPKGYGWIKSEEFGDIFVHNVDCPSPRDGSPPLRECELVSFTVTKEAKGLRAKNVYRVLIPKGVEYGRETGTEK